MYFYWTYLSRLHIVKTAIFHCQKLSPETEAEKFSGRMRLIQISIDFKYRGLSCIRTFSPSRSFGGWTSVGLNLWMSWMTLSKNSLYVCKQMFIPLFFYPWFIPALEYPYALKVHWLTNYDQGSIGPLYTVWRVRWLSPKLYFYTFFRIWLYILLIHTGKATRRRIHVVKTIGKSMVGERPLVYLSFPHFIKSNTLPSTFFAPRVCRK